MNRLLSLLLFLLIPLWCFADTPAIYQTPKGLKDSTVTIYIPAKYFGDYNPPGREIIDYPGLCKDYTGDSRCYLLTIDSTHEHNVVRFEKTSGPFLYVTVKPVGGKAGITIINEVTK